MKNLCWLGEERTFEEVLMILGHSKSRIKKSNLSKKERCRRIRYREEISIPQELHNWGIINPSFEWGEAKEAPFVIEERGDILAVHKPSHLHIHPLIYNEKNNLLSFLRKKGYSNYLLEETELEDKSPWDGGLLYRIDYETSGLVLLSSNGHLYDQMRRHKDLIKEKVYLVVVEGRFSLKNGVYEHKLTTSGKKVKASDQGLLSHIDIEVLMVTDQASLLKVSLKEGRRHQIRVQLALLGYPIWGDTLYGASEKDSFGLHCFQYEFENGQVYTASHFWGLDFFSFSFREGSLVLVQ